MQNTALLDQLIEWLDGQDPLTKYYYTDSRTCVMAQFFKARGAVEYKDYSFDGEALYKMLPGLNEVALGRPSSDAEDEHPLRWTYGAALNRARALREKLL